MNQYVVSVATRQHHLVALSRVVDRDEPERVGGKDEQNQRSDRKDCQRAADRHRDQLIQVLTEKYTTRTSPAPTPTQRLAKTDANAAVRDMITPTTHAMTGTSSGEWITGRDSNAVSHYSERMTRAGER